MNPGSPEEIYTKKMEEREAEEAAKTEKAKVKKPYGEISPANKFHSIRFIHMYWLDKLSPSEFMVLMFIWQRSVFWGKEYEFIKYRHFLKGIPDEIRPLPLRERRLQQILKSLEGMKVIKRQTRVYGSWYGINYGSLERKLKGKKRRTPKATAKKKGGEG